MTTSIARSAPKTSPAPAPAPKGASAPRPAPKPGSAAPKDAPKSAYHHMKDSFEAALRRHGPGSGQVARGGTNDDSV